MADDQLEKLFGALTQILSVGIFDTRQDAIRIKTVDGGSRLYYAKPFESFCMENLSFMFKHFNETLFQSGISQLINHSVLHDTFYKDFTIAYNNKDKIDLSFKLSYVTRASFEQAGDLDVMNVRKLLQTPQKQIVKCHVCSESKIELMLSDTSVLVYSHKQAQETESVNSQAQDHPYSELKGRTPVPQKRVLTSERYVSDYHFSKDATFFHALRNSGPRSLEVVT